MSKQLFQRNDSSESLQLQEEAGSHASTALQGKSTPSFFAPSKKYKTLLLVVGVLAGVAVCAVAATAIGATQAQRSAGAASTGAPQLERREQHDDPLIDMATKEQLLRKVLPAQQSNICYHKHQVHVVVYCYRKPYILCTREWYRRWDSEYMYRGMVWYDRGA